MLYLFASQILGSEARLQELRDRLLLDVNRKPKPENKFKCPLCHYSSTEMGKLQRHIRCVHTGEKPFKCTYCDYRTGDKSCLRKHLFTHKGKAFQCPKCPFSASQPNKLEDHMTLSHADDIDMSPSGVVAEDQALGQ